MVVLIALMTALRVGKQHRQASFIIDVVLAELVRALDFRQITIVVVRAMPGASIHVHKPH
ncbi:hypothetical protein SDC9_159729 [bioreactor metagenome]|uniref:Uncharacterized protein n=1 Tax=bioreactor metagenome TaxID=1076179 RepID=A0A645FDH0_9ZZZZ